MSLIPQLILSIIGKIVDFILRRESQPDCPAPAPANPPKKK